MTQPSGSLLEHLHFHRDLVNTPFFEPALKERVTRLSNFRHATYAKVRRLQREDKAGLVLVSTHVPGRRLSVILQMGARARVRPSTPAVLSLTRQLMSGTALLHDSGPDVFHGALGPERIILAGDGRIALCEYVLGAAVEEAARAWGIGRLWRDWRVAALPDTATVQYGRRLDTLQVGLVTLACLIGRPLAASDYPEGLAQLLEDATELGPDGFPIPLRAELRAWLERMVGLDPQSAFRTLLEAQKGLTALLQEGTGYGASSTAFETFMEQCETAAPWPTASEEAGGATEPSDPFAPWPAERTSALLDAFQPAHPPLEPVDLVNRAAEEPHQEDSGPAEGEGIHTLFEAPPADPDEDDPVDQGVGRPPDDPWSEGDAGRKSGPHPVLRPDAWASPVPQPSDTQPPVVVVTEQPPMSARRMLEAVAEAPPPPTRLQLPVDGQDRSPRFKAGIVALAAVVVLGGAVGLFVMRPWAGSSRPPDSQPPVAVAGPGDTATTPEILEGAGQLGGLRIQTTPPGQQVSLDGTPRGSAPLRLTDLAPGVHLIAAEGPFGTAEQEVAVVAGQVTAITVATAGWLRIASPFPLQVAEKGRVFGSSGDGQVMVPAGRHHFDLINEEVAFRTRQFVNVPPGEVVRVPFEPPLGMMNLYADRPAEVWLDGKSVGQTPLSSLPVALGAHEVVFKNPEHGEVSYSVMVTLTAPVRLAVTFRK